MQRVLLAISILCLSTTALRAQTVNVFNAASLISTDFPNGGVTHGGRLLVVEPDTSVRLGTCGTTNADQFPTPTNLNGTTMSIAMGDGSFDVPIVSVVACSGTGDQITGIVPSGVPAGLGTLTVSYNGLSVSSPITVFDRLPGIYTINQLGTGPAHIQNTNPGADPVDNTLATPATPEQTEILWATGLGPDGNSDVDAPTQTDIPMDIHLYVGGQAANITYKGRSDCCAGVDQIIFQVPDGLDGCFVPIVVKVGSVVSNVSTMSISVDGSPCSDPLTFTAADITTAQANGHLRVGFVDLIRNEAVAPSFPGATMGLLTGSDIGYTEFADIPFSTFTGLPVRIVSTPGSCTVLRGSDLSDDIFGPPILLPISAFAAGTGVVAGSADVVTVTGPTATMSIHVDTPYSKEGLGIISAFDPPFPNVPSFSPTFLDPGNYTVSAPGASPLDGLAVGPFTAQITAPGIVNFTNRYALAQTLDRTQSVSVTWTGGDPNGYVLITGTSLSAIPAQPGPHADFYCVEHASAGQFTLPDYVLLSLPPTFQGQIAGLGFGLAVGQIGATRFSADGLDVGLLRYNVTIGRSLGWN
ncbi:MAG TPA: hypothetical protein VKU01_15265 [Bryobacteraceae bacterium]|nr:hypothetical protein [Bryobacteraceae bacterium]